MAGFKDIEIKQSVFEDSKSFPISAKTAKALTPGAAGYLNR